MPKTDAKDDAAVVQLATRVPRQLLRLRVYIDGQPIRQTMGKTDYEEAAVREKNRILNDLKRGDSVPHEDRLTPADLRTLIKENYELRENASIDTMLSTWKHLDAFFGERCKVSRIGPRTERYVSQRKKEGAPVDSIRTELALLDRSLTLAVQKKRLSHRARPYIEKPSLDSGRGTEPCRCSSATTSSTSKTSAAPDGRRVTTRGRRKSLSRSRQRGQGQFKHSRRLRRP